MRLCRQISDSPDLHNAIFLAVRNPRAMTLEIWLSRYDSAAIRLWTNFSGPAAIAKTPWAN